MATPLFQLDRIDRRFKVGPVTIEALRGVSLEVRPGELVSISGPSGSGKSVLLNLLGLLDRPTSGRHLFGGRDLAAASDDERTLLRNRRIGFVFQAAPMLPRLTALENVALPLHYRRLPPREALAAARDQLARVGLADRAGHRPHQLSGGQLQRVAIARALVGAPDLVLADEPTAALDPDTTEEILALLLGLNRADGVTVLLVTHQRAHAERCPRRLVLTAGRLEPAPEPAAAP